ncbi:MAG: 50S ribosomal protein L11 methyltransferase [Chloroflexi bacterium]|nr:50S ribosomal protein L11 methyltransferase [Chloroflexota bacterium]
MPWVEVSVEVEEEAAEAVAEQLHLHGQGVAIEVPFVQPSLYDDAERDPTRQVVIKTYLPDDASADLACRQIEAALWHIGQLRRVGPLLTRRIAEEDWATSWKPFFPVVHVGRRTVIVPAWRRYRGKAGDVIIRLDPGLAFGTGTHPTTRLCLQAMEALVRSHSRVLDVGAGSGILAIAAARLGAPSVTAIEIDPQAADAARSNVRLNHLTRRIHVCVGSPDDTGGPWRGRWHDLIVSNVTARVNTRLAPTLVELLDPRGTIIASGILVVDLDAVAEAFGGAGLQVKERLIDEDWGALVAGRAG